MKLEIKNKVSGEIIFSLECSSFRICVEAALKAGSDLSGSDLRGSDLSGSDLRGSDLSGSDLRGSDLSGSRASEEEIARLDAVREVVLRSPDRLRMDYWHSESWDAAHTPEEEHTCKSTHCLSGWLQALSPDPKVRLMDPEEAGLLLAPASSYMFYMSDSIAMQWLKDRLYARMHETACPELGQSPTKKFRDDTPRAEIF